MREMLVIDGGQLQRLMRICRKINSSEGAPIPRLQAMLKASRRTIFRDFDLLRKMGIELELYQSHYRIRRNVAACRKAITDYQLRIAREHMAECLK